MEQNLNSGLFIDLTNQEMVELNGGSKVIELAAKVFGYIFGSIARIQVYSGDNGQWMA